MSEDSVEAEDILFTCAFCSIDNYYKRGILLKNGTKHSKSMYRCSYCGLRVTFSYIKSNKFKLEKLCCDYCDYKSLHPSKLEHHINLKHLKEYFYQCSICGTTFNNVVDFESHFKRHTSIKTPFKCLFCGLYQETKYALEIHVNGKHTRAVSYQCEVCEYKTYWKSVLKRHCAKHKKHKENKESNTVKEVPTKVLKCLYCKFTATSNFVLSRHVSRYHINNNSLQCQFCNFRTAHEPLLEHHIAKIHKTQKVFSCKKCDFKSKVSNHLAKHYSVVHFNRIHRCKYCEYSSWQRSTLLRHEQGKHNKSLLKCPHCDLKYTWERTLSLHIEAIHATNEKSYSCDYCEYKSNYKHTLKNHVNSKHTKENIFYCNFCSYECTSKGTLVRHISAKHEKPLNKCQVLDCTFKSRNKTGIAYHMKKKHKMSMKNRGSK